MEFAIERQCGWEGLRPYPGRPDRQVLRVCGGHRRTRRHSAKQDHRLRDLTVDATDGPSDPEMLAPSALPCRSCNGVAYRAAFAGLQDRKSTRLNSSHGYISYAVFCLKKNNNS